MWILDVESDIFSRIKNEGTAKLKKQFPKIFFTAENETIATPVFPTVYVEELSGMERGRDLEGLEINAYLFTFQINVSHNGKKQEAKAVMDVCMGTMKKLKFEVVAYSPPVLMDGVWECTARFRRNIGASDIL